MSPGFESGENFRPGYGNAIIDEYGNRRFLKYPYGSGEDEPINLQSDPDSIPFKEAVSVGNSSETYKCTNEIIANVLGPAVEKLGDTGISRIQDWRDDQASKLRTIEREFRRIAEENEDEMGTEKYEYFSTFSFGTEIYEHLKSTELLPVQKTYRWFNQNLINHGRGKEKVYNEYGEDPFNPSDGAIGYQDWNMSGEMQDYQTSKVNPDFTVDRFGDEAIDLEINQYDPWIQGIISENRPPYRMPLDNGPNGSDQRVFNWTYPVEELTESPGNYQTGEPIPAFWEDHPIPEWEQELYDVGGQTCQFISMHLPVGGTGVERVVGETHGDALKTVVIAVSQCMVVYIQTPGWIPELAMMVVLHARTLQS